MNVVDVARPWLIWGYDFSSRGGTVISTGATEIDHAIPAGSFRWLHLNLADQRTFAWLNRQAAIPEPARELLRSTDLHARALILDSAATSALAGVLPDFERDLDGTAFAQTGALRFVLTDTLMITARLHPVCAADIILRRIELGASPKDSPAALDLLISSLAQVGSDLVERLIVSVQQAEDALLNEDRSPNVRALVMVRRRAVQLHRHLYGVRGVLARLEDEEDVPEKFEATLARLIQRVSALDGDVGVLQSNLRELRDELDVQTANRVNQNLYVISVLSAVLLPATFVTGFFGMNTGGMLWLEEGGGTLKATVIIAAVGIAVFFWLRARGFFKI
jgi:zinc transporter